jgi:alpha-tubulin suppressor-like RCC1 family protein
MNCAVLDTGLIKCWGYNAYGSLGLGDQVSRGKAPEHMGNNLPAVDLGAGKLAAQIDMGAFHTCARLTDGAVKCWGACSQGVCGLPGNPVIGDGPNEMGDNLPTVDLGVGAAAAKLALGSYHSCALLTDGRVKCWGQGDRGQLGLGDPANRGDNPGEMGDALPAVDLGGGVTVIDIESLGDSTCALLGDGSVKCWGWNLHGQLGLGDTANRGDGPGEMGDALPAVDLGTGRTAVAIASAIATCAVLDDGSLKCWGQNYAGGLGLGDVASRGDQPGEMGDALPTVKLFTEAW